MAKKQRSCIGIRVCFPDRSALLRAGRSAATYIHPELEFYNVTLRDVPAEIAAELKAGRTLDSQTVSERTQLMQSAQASGVDNRGAFADVSLRRPVIIKWQCDDNSGYSDRVPYDSFYGMRLSCGDLEYGYATGLIRSVVGIIDEMRDTNLPLCYHPLTVAKYFVEMKRAVCLRYIDASLYTYAVVAPEHVYDVCSGNLSSPLALGVVANTPIATLAS
jgi:hypothetical protein